MGLSSEPAPVGSCSRFCLDFKNNVLFSKSGSMERWGNVCKEDKFIFDGSFSIKDLSPTETSAVKLNHFGNLVAVWTKSSLLVRFLKHGAFAVLLENSTTIVWVGWNPTSPLGNHLTALTAEGNLYLFVLDQNDKTFEIMSSTRVRSSEDGTLNCVSATFDGVSLWILLENGDIINISIWIPLPALVSKEFYDSCTMEGLLFDNENNTYLVTSLKNFASITVSKPCLIQPDPIEVTGGDFQWIEAITFRGVTFLLMNWGNSRIDVFTVSDVSFDSNPLLVLIESINFPQNGQFISCKSVKCFYPKFIISQGNSIYYFLEFEWIDHFLNSIIHDIPLDIIRSKVTLINVKDALDVFPFFCHLTGELKILIVTESYFKIVSLLHKQNLESSMEFIKRRSNLLESFNDLPLSKVDKNLMDSTDLDLIALFFNSSDGDLKLSTLSEDGLASLMSTIIDPLRSGIFAKIIAADTALNKSMEFVEKAIKKQTEWIDIIERRSQNQKVLVIDLEKRFQDSVSKERKIFDRISRISSLLENPQIFMSINYDLVKLKLDELSVLLNSIEVPNKQISHVDDLDLLSATIQELGSRLSHLDVY